MRAVILEQLLAALGAPAIDRARKFRPRLGLAQERAEARALERVLLQPLDAHAGRDVGFDGEQIHRTFAAAVPRQRRALREADHVGHLRPPDGRRVLDRCMRQLAEHADERFDRRDAAGRAGFGARAQIRAIGGALAQRADRRTDERGRVLLRPVDVARGGGLAGEAHELVGAEAGLVEDVRERGVVRVNAHALVREPDHGCFAAGPAQPLGVAQRAARDDERHARDRIDGEVHAERQALAHVEIVAVRIGRARDEAELRGELVRVRAERLRERAHQREEDRIRHAGAIRIADAGAREDRLAGVARDAIDVVLGGIRDRDRGWCARRGWRDRGGGRRGRDVVATCGANGDHHQGTHARGISRLALVGAEIVVAVAARGAVDVVEHVGERHALGPCRARRRAARSRSRYRSRCRPAS